MRTKLFIDANILLEIMFTRSKMQQVSTLLHDDRFEFYISSLTVHILYYFAEVEKVDREWVKNLAGLAAWLPITTAMVEEAQRRYAVTGGKDFEDCLQAACAEFSDCAGIVSLDKRFGRHSATKLPVDVL